MSDRTIIRPVRPRFGINEISYSRVSATHGYVEPLCVAKIDFDVQFGSYRYSFYFGTLVERDNNKLMPITLLETELITLCEALDVQINVLERQLTESQKKMNNFCNEELIQPASELPDEKNGIVTPKAPRFGYNEVVYLIESAETTGSLEAMRVDSFKWDNNIGEWVYVFRILPRPRRNTTVGDRNDLRRGSIIMMVESQLCKICEALPLVVNFLEVAVSRARFRRETLCGGSG